MEGVKYSNLTEEILMSRTLITFIGSSNVGTYLNTISHLSDKYDIEKIIFISLTEAPLEIYIDIDKIITAELYEVISELAENKYKGKSLNLSEEERKIYYKAKEIMSRNKRIRTVNYNFFNSELEKIIKDAKEDVIFDITALPKRIGIDVFVELLSIGFNNIINFEIKNPKKAKNTENGFLYHSLVKENNYELVFLSKEEQFYKNVKYYILQQEKSKFLCIFISLLISTGIAIVQVFINKKIELTTLLLFLSILSGVIPLIEFALISVNKGKRNMS